jgi:hypothetical protein
LMRVCDALELAHRRGFVHRDVKCDNIMLGEFGEVYLLDWGVALRLADAGDAIEIVGTPCSMAPEMARGDARAVDARSDVYLLGATLHHALTGRPRHEGTTLHAVLLAAFLSEPPVPSPDVPDELAALVRRATAADPAERPASAAAFREELAAFLRHRTSSRIMDDAIARFDRLESEDPRALTSPASTRTLTEVRFGLTQALREWPENERARAGLERALTACVRAELLRDSPGAATSVLAEMRAPPVELVREVRAAEQRSEERASLAAAAIDEAAERDAGRSAPVRRSMAGVFVAVTVSLVLGAFAVAGPNPGVYIGYGTGFVLDVAFLAVSLSLVYVTRARTLVNRWSRDAVGLFLVAAVGTSLSHAIGWLRHDDIALRGDAPTQLLFAVTFAIGSMLLSRRLLIAAALACVAALVSAIWPAVSLWASAATVTTGAVLLAQGSGRTRLRTPREA